MCELHFKMTLKKRKRQPGEAVLLENGTVSKGCALRRGDVKLNRVKIPEMAV
jgi:hypothetical protein